MSQKKIKSISQKRQNTKHKKEKGAILVLTLIVLSLVSLLAVKISQYSLFDYSVANLSHSQINGKMQAESIRNVFTRLIGENVVYSKTDFEKLQKEFPLLLTQLFDETIQAEVNDENAFFPINGIFGDSDSSSVRQLNLALQNLIHILIQEHRPTMEEDERDLLVDCFMESLFQWNEWSYNENDANSYLNSKDEEAQEWYLDQNPPYLPSGMELQSPSDLTFLYLPDFPTSLREDLLYGTKKTIGLLSLVSVHNTSTINISTAHPYIIQATVKDQEKAEDCAKEIISARKSSFELEKESWYQDIFDAHGGSVLSFLVMSDKTRLFRVHFSFGKKPTTNYIGIGFTMNGYLRWYYQRIY